MLQFSGIIFCKNEESTSLVAKKLKEESVFVIEINESHDCVQIKQVLGQRSRHYRYVLVISDKSTLDAVDLVSREDVVLHFDYPEKKSSFEKRFLRMKEFVTSIYVKDLDQPSCHLFISPQDDFVFQTVKDLLLRCGAEIPQELAKLVKNKSQMEASKRSKDLFCETLKRFGKCDVVKSRCKSRHFIDPQSTNHGPIAEISSGFIDFHVKRIIRGNHYLVKLKTIKDFVGKELFDYKKSYTRLGFKLATLIPNEKVNDVEIGGLYLHKGKDEVFKRVKIGKLFKKSKEDFVSGLYIDEAEYFEFLLQTSEFWELPDSLGNYIVTLNSCWDKTYKFFTNFFASFQICNDSLKCLAK